MPKWAGYKSITALENQAEKKADVLRLTYDLGERGISDIFMFIETLGYLLLRYPFGEQMLDGFTTIYRGQYLIVTNSSKILARETFTAAHELGHCCFDLQSLSNQTICDQETGGFNTQQQPEYRADCFAARFLMPSKGLINYLEEFGLADETPISYSDVIRLQLAFGTSYRAVVRRLRDIGRIDRDEQEHLYSYFEDIGINLHGLFRRANAESSALLEASQTISIPRQYMQSLEKNYERGYIFYPTLEKIFTTIGKTPEDFGFEKKDEIAEEEVDADDLLKELGN